MSKKVNELNTEDLESVSGGGYEFDRTTIDDGVKTIVFKKVGGPQTRLDSKLIGDKLREEGVNVDEGTSLGKRNRAVIGRWLNNMRLSGWEKAPAEISYDILDNRVVSTGMKYDRSKGSYEDSDYEDF